MEWTDFSLVWTIFFLFDSRCEAARHGADYLTNDFFDNGHPTIERQYAVKLQMGVRCTEVQNGQFSSVWLKSLKI